ncbi:MAG: DEAD/DEAH box helicase family protein [Candidatus Woesearchaeota archaeon]
MTRKLTMKMMLYKQSNSTNNIFDNCEFQFYLTKVDPRTPESDDKPQFGNAGTLVHDILEEWFENKYYNLDDKQQKETIAELQKKFYKNWKDQNITRLNAQQYWQCVLNGIKYDLRPTHNEEFYNVETNQYEWVAKIDALNDIDKWVLDYKTSNFKPEKVQEYFYQLLGYAFSIYKNKGYYPQKLIVLFLKQPISSPSFKFELNFNEDDSADKTKYYSPKDIQRFEESLIAHQKKFEYNFKNISWDRATNSPPNSSACFFCDFKKYCQHTLKGDLKVVFDIYKNQVYMRFLTGPPPKILIDKIEEQLTYYLPEEQIEIAKKKFQEKTGMYWDGSIKLYNRDKSSFKIGFIDRVRNVFEHFGEFKRERVFIKIDDNRKEIPSFSKYPMTPKLNFKHELYQYQKEAVQTILKKKVGIIELPTGAGKSIVAAEVIRRANTPSLYIIDNKELLQQTKEDYEKLLNTEIGTIIEGNFNPGKKVTVATIQTIMKLKDDPKLKEFMSNINLVIADELQIWGSDSYQKVDELLENCKWRIGMSATPYRTDGHDMLLEQVCGQIIYKKSVSDIPGLKKPEIKFYEFKGPKKLETVQKEYNGVTVEEKATWRDDYELAIVNNDERNKKIKELVEQEYKGKQIMIVASREEHLKKLNELIPNSKMFYGKTKKKERAQTIEDFKNCEFEVLITNISIVQKGLNIPTLEVIINASGNSSEIITTQLCGRLNREHPDKKEKYYVDFFDKGSQFKNASNRFTTIKKKLGYEFEIIK